MLDLSETHFISKVFFVVEIDLENLKCSSQKH